MRLASASPSTLAPAKDQAALAPDKNHLAPDKNRLAFAKNHLAPEKNHLASDKNRFAFAKKQRSRGLSGGAPCLTCESQPGVRGGEPDLETPHLLSSEFQGEGRAVQR